MMSYRNSSALILSLLLLALKQTFFVTAFLFGAVAIALAQGEFNLLAKIERAFEANEPGWKFERVSMPLRAVPMQVEDGRPLLSPRGEHYSYRLTSDVFTGAVFIFRGDSALDARNQLEWERRREKMNEMQSTDRIGEQSFQISGHGAGRVIFRKTNIFILLTVWPVGVSILSPSEIEEKTPLALGNVIRMAKRIAEQIPAT